MSRATANIIRELLLKKQQLAKQLLLKSQYFVLEQNPSFQEKLLASKAKIIEQLQTNDCSISTWEQQTGKIAKNVEKGLHTDILRLFRLTSENDAHSQTLLKREYRKLLLEKKKFSQGTRISGYLQRRNRSGSSNPTVKSGGASFKQQGAYHENRRN